MSLANAQNHFRCCTGWVTGPARRPHWCSGRLSTSILRIAWLAQTPSELEGQEINLKQIDIPVFVMAVFENDISPWQGVVAVHDAFTYLR